MCSWGNNNNSKSKLYNNPIHSNRPKFYSLFFVELLLTWKSTERFKRQFRLWWKLQCGWRWKELFFQRSLPHTFKKVGLMNFLSAQRRKKNCEWNILTKYFQFKKNHRNWIHLNFQFWHFPPIFVILELTCLVTLYDRKFQFSKSRLNDHF